MADDRIRSIPENSSPDLLFTTISRRQLPSVSFAALLEAGMLNVGDALYSRDQEQVAFVCADGSIKTKSFRGSIHKVGALVEERKSSNGWDYWYFERNGAFSPLDTLRQEYRQKYLTVPLPSK